MAWRYWLVRFHAPGRLGLVGGSYYEIRGHGTHDFWATHDGGITHEKLVSLNNVKEVTPVSANEALMLMEYPVVALLHMPESARRVFRRPAILSKKRWDRHTHKLRDIVPGYGASARLECWDYGHGGMSIMTTYEEKGS